MRTIGVDVGGTFTDLVFSDKDSGAIAIHKVSTTPEDPSLGVMTGIRELCADNAIDPGSIDYVFHGTTTATNAVLEHKGAVTGMITNDGFRDIIHIARHQRAEHYSIMQELPWQNRPLIKRRYRKTVKGRLVPPHGDELEPLDEAAVWQAAEELRDAGVESVAVCFLFSYLNPAHENHAAAIVREVLPDAFVTTSSAVSPQFREFERFTTAALTAFIGPKVRRYVAHLDGALKDAGLKGDLRMMASNGGVATADDGVGAAGPDASLRSRRGGARRRLGRRIGRKEAADHLRHRRHQRRHRHRRRRQVRRDRRPLDLDRRLPAPDADDRHPHHRRRWRLDRLSRPRRRLQGRAAERRRGARARRLWQGAAPSRR